MIRRLLSVAAVAVGALIGAAPAVSAEPAPELRAPAPFTMPNGMEHCTLQFESGSDLKHYADWVLDEVGVSDSDAPSRYPNGWEMTKLDMVFLFLTPEECDDAQALTGTGPLLAAESAQVVSLPTPVEGGGPYVAPGQRGEQIVPAGIERIGTPVAEWNFAPSPGRVKVAVVDTGADGRHHDLNVAGGYNCSQDARGPDGFDIDLHGHGTHVAGTIGATHDDADVVGVAPGVALYSEAVFSTGSASGAMVLCGVNKALEHGADIISASLGGGSIATRCGGPSVYSNGWCKAARQAVIVVAAGNDATDAIYKSPANVDADALVTVGAVIDYDGLPGGEGLGYPGCGFTHLDDAFAVFSNHGREVEVVAPGGCVLSTTPGGTLSWMSGTSMSTPHVTGVFAAFMAEFADCRGADAVRTVLRYAERYARDHPDEGYTGWPGADPPPLIRYVDEDPWTGYTDPDDEQSPCKFESAVES